MATPIGSDEPLYFQYSGPNAGGGLFFVNDIMVERSTKAERDGYGYRYPLVYVQIPFSEESEERLQRGLISDRGNARDDVLEALAERVTKNKVFHYAEILVFIAQNPTMLSDFI